MRKVALSALAVFLPLAVACEPEIGSPCDPDTTFVNQLVEQREGTNNLVLDVRLDNCSQGFCLSTDGSRPYCTKRCTGNAECAEAGEGFVCQEVVTFGPLACDDFEDPNAPRRDTTPSGTACAGGAGCAGEEICFAQGEFQDTCGVPGRDCLTGPDGSQSPVPFSYCAASSVDIIQQRDLQFGRQ